MRYLCPSVRDPQNKVLRVFLYFEKTSTLMMADHRWYAAFYISCNDHKLLLMGFSEKVVKFYDRSVFIINIMPEFSKRQ